MADRIVKVILRGEIGDLRAKMTVAGKSVKDAADRMTAAGKEGEKFRRGLDEIGSSAGKMGLAATAGLGAIVLASANFDQAMSKVQASTHESTANMERLRDAAIEAGARTAFSASEAAAGIENLAKAGVATGDILGGGLQGALDLAAAGSLDVAAAAEAAATAMTQFGLKGTDVPHIADLLAAAAGKAQGEVADMNQALAQGGLVANAMGLSIEETVGGLAAFAKAGLLGSDAGTSLKTMLQRLQAPIGAAADTMKKLGLSAYDSQGNFIGLAEFAGQLNDKLKDMTDEQRNAALATIFGSDAVRAANVIYEQGEAGIRNWITAVDDQGFASETAAIKMDNLKGDLEAFKGSLETLLIGMGEGAQGPLRGLVQGLTKVTNAFGSLPSAAQGTITALLGITAITGGGLWFGSKVIRGIADTREAMKSLGIETGKTSRLMRGMRGAGIAAGIASIGFALDSLFTKKLDGSNLQRSLTALSNGAVTGALRDAFGDDLKNLGSDVAAAAEFMNSSGFAKGLSNIGIAGLDLGGGAKDAADRIGELDASLAGLVESGQAEEAARLFKIISDAARESGTSTEFTAEVFEQYGTALYNLNPPTSGLAGMSNFLSETLDGVGHSSEGAAKKQDALSEATTKAKKAARDQAKAWIGLGDGVDDAEVSLQKWLSSLEDQAKALEDFTTNARKAAKRGLREGLIAELEAAGPAGALRMQQLANGTDKEIERANRAWKRGQDAIRDYVKLQVPPKKIKFDMPQFLKDLQHVTNLLHGIPDETVVIRGQWKNPENPRQADGSYATGGYTGDGGKYDPAGIVHRGEYVFSKEATQGNLAMLDAMHRQLRGYSSGGYVGGTASGAAMTGVGIDYDRLAHSLARVRPMYGDVHVVDGYGGFKRQMEQDRALAAIGGIS